MTTTAFHQMTPVEGGEVASALAVAVADLVAALATLAKVRAIVADPHAALVVDRIRAALEPTEQPKGKP